MEGATWENTRDYCELPLMTKLAKVIKVYDGDTVWVATELDGHGLCRINIRLARIDTPEIKDKDPTKKQAAIQARDVLRELILGKIVSITIGGPKSLCPRKRCIGEINLVPPSDSTLYYGAGKAINVSDFMLAGGYAVAYKK